MAELYKVNTSDPSTAITPRHIKVTLKLTSSALWAINTVRLIYARKAHVIAKWWVGVYRRHTRTKVTLKYTSSELWAIDSIRLVQRLVNQGPHV